MEIYGNNMKEVLLILGFILFGFIMGVWTIGNTKTYNNGQLVSKLITKCEQTLPRNEKCYIKAEPKTPKNKDFKWPPNKYR